ncbi:hypothetical protein [Vibrio sinaloensis]|uniref:hypothetical protein n=1 Tax=Photobacterium sp. (strain ATCC 43367) TaxID=379097 RepID=UPI002064886D|nr:hypothetical protein [Vibrio sinaloensis]UPQ89007.1 hypothetical protein MTO69_05610 [Vibrio sinaloensis]
MERTSVQREYRLLIIAILCAALAVFGHVILSKSFADLVWIEYTAAAIPFVMFGLCLFAIRYAANDRNNG